MRIDGAQVRELRRERLWSQEELAVASGLNLRTIQRIEAEGVISLQSKKSLAAAFDLEVGVLDYQEKPRMTKSEFKVLRFDVKGFFGGKLDCASMESQLNEVGAQGWSLVKMTEILGGDGGNTVMVLAIFQRSVE